MAKELPYFKFEPSEWAFGRINKQNKDVKVAFIDLICKYWHNLCVMTLEDAILDFGKDEIDILVKTKIIKIEENFIKVNFLDIQFEEISENTEKLSRAGKESARKRSLKIEQSSTPVEQSSTDKIRLDEIKEDKIKKDNSQHDYEKILLIQSESFINKWNDFLKFRKEIKKPYKSFQSMKLQILELKKFDDKTAIEMIDQSIRNSWQGIFDLKNINNNGTTNKIKPIIEFKPGGPGNL